MRSSLITKIGSFIAIVVAVVALAPVAAHAATIFSDGFEGGGNLTGWSVSGSQWAEIGGAGTAHAGSRSALVTDDTGSNADTLTQIISTTGNGNIALNYWYRITQNLGPSDHVYVQWSTNGSTWNTVADYNDISSGSWTSASHVLPAGAANNAGFRVRFSADLSTNSGGDSDEFRLDDISVTGDAIAPENTLARCTDGIDNDLDGKTDYTNPATADLDCISFGPKIQMTRVVVNDNGGSATTADFTSQLTPNSYAGGTSSYASTPVTVSVVAGNYTVGATAITGYTITYSGDCNASGAVVASLTNPSTTYSCTITANDNPAHLIVVKDVVNDNAGSNVASDFTMTITGVTAIGGNSFAGASGAGVDKVLSTIGAYSVGEVAFPGYSMTGASAQCSGTIALGETKTCTITNNDNPPVATQGTITIVTNVINDNGGTAVPADFSSMPLGSNVVPNTQQPGSNAGVNFTIDPGSHGAVLYLQTGYMLTSATAGCSGSIAAGETKTCTLTIDDQPATITVVKQVINDNGGTSVPSDATIIVDATDPSQSSFAGSDEGTVITVDAGEYSIDEDSESMPFGYTKTLSAGCSGALSIGQSALCTITNDDQPGTLTIIKHVINDNGDSALTKVAGDFTMTVSGTNPSLTSFAGDELGTVVTIDAGSYSVSEATIDGPYPTGLEALAGYVKSLSADCTGTIGIGESKTCTITNNDAEATRSLCTDGIDNDGNEVIDTDEPVCKALLGLGAGQGGEGGGGSGGSVLGASTENTNTNGGEQPKPEEPKGEVLGAVCEPYLKSFIGFGRQNDTEQVIKLQKFLNTQGYNVPTTGVYGPTTMTAVKDFQIKHKDEVLTPWATYGISQSELESGTGFVGPMTIRTITKIVLGCDIATLTPEVKVIQ